MFTPGTSVVHYFTTLCTLIPASVNVDRCVHNLVFPMSLDYRTPVVVNVLADPFAVFSSVRAFSHSRTIYFNKQYE
jgi:hypothetical protein